MTARSLLLLRVVAVGVMAMELAALLLLLLPPLPPLLLSSRRCISAGRGKAARVGEDTARGAGCSLTMGAHVRSGEGGTRQWRAQRGAAAESLSAWVAACGWRESECRPGVLHR